MTLRYTVMLKFEDEDKTPEEVFSGSAEEVYYWLCTTRITLTDLDVVENESSTYYHAWEFRNKVRSSIFVDKYYEMDPETEDLLPDGGYLADGMMVLIENADLRSRASEITVDWQMDRYKTYNRWCRVTKLRVSGINNSVSFVGVYADGTKRTLSVGLHEPWYVKIHSIGGSLTQTTQRYHEADMIVRTAFGKLVDRCRDGGIDSETFTYDDILEETKEKLLDTL